MPFPLRVQPIDLSSIDELTRHESAKPVVKSRLKRLFERQFPSVLRTSAAEKIAGVDGGHCNRDGCVEFEPSSVCLAKMVQNFIEDNDKQSATTRCGRNRCNCFNGNFSGGSDDELDSLNCSCGDACEILKGLVPCDSVYERNLQADTSKIVEKSKITKRKEDCLRKIVTDGLLALGYDASICKSRWEKAPSYPAGEYEYVDVMVEGERFIIDIDFRSEFEIARSTKSYKLILQTLPSIFVGKPDRLQKIVTVVSEAAKQSLKKNGMYFPPWRKAEYVKSKWLSLYTRITPTPPHTSLNLVHTISPESDLNFDNKEALIFAKAERISPVEADQDDCVFSLSYSSGEGETLGVNKLEPSEVKGRMNSPGGVKIVTGFVSVIEDKP